MSIYVYSLSTIVLLFISLSDSYSQGNFVPGYIVIPIRIQLKGLSTMALLISIQNTAIISLMSRGKLSIINPKISLDMIWNWGKNLFPGQLLRN